MDNWPPEPLIQCPDMIDRPCPSHFQLYRSPSSPRCWEASAVLSWKLAKMIEAREKEQKKKQKRQENIAKAKRLKKD
ncbi:small integral membrane protein 15-like [Sciurus carolinensis]|uniref:small integral membrane protein 15-like n=1 Tax=Sciurus carolinensis TaxID=30640 RepID=UPI001FB3557A|nr:small integral membrane protein 15-like [Sciurus carolinensis]